MPATAPLETRYRARSLWLDGLAEPLEPRAALEGDLQCDAAIVGAGFTGLWAAYYLKQAQPDLRVAVIEREIAGYGPSGRNGGWVSSGLPGSVGVWARTRGRDSVRRAVGETQNTVDEIGRVVAAESIDCGYLKAGMLMVATSEPQRRRLVAGIEEEQSFGADTRLVESAELASLSPSRRALAAEFSPHCARVDPGRLVRGLARAVERLGVQIYERTAARQVEPGRIVCEGGSVKAEIVLRATESYTTQLPGEQLRYLPLYSLMIATEPLPDDVWGELGWKDGLMVGDRHHLFYYAQRTEDGRIAIGGRGAPYELREPISERHERSDEVKQRLIRAVRRDFPPAADARITHHWGGPLGVPRDWCMSVTYDPATRFGTSGGYSGHGVVASNIGGRTLADLALGRETDLVSLPWVGHKCRRWEPEPLRFIASRAIVRMLSSADRHEDKTGKPARRTKLVAPVMPPH